MVMYRNKKILRSAKGQPCTVRSVWCNGDPATTVAAHSNQSIHGKGKGIKAHDCYVAYACSGCHRWLDESAASRAEKVEAFNAAMHRTWLLLLQNGVLK